MNGIHISTPILGVIFALLITLAGLLAYKASHTAGSKFNLDEAFTDATGKTSMARICTFTALATTTWALVALVQSGKLTEWFLAAYLGAFVLNGVASKYIEKKDAP